MGVKYLSNTTISQHHKFVYCHFARHGDLLKLQILTNSLNAPETRYQIRKLLRISSLFDTRSCLNFSVNWGVCVRKGLEKLIRNKRRLVHELALRSANGGTDCRGRSCRFGENEISRRKTESNWGEEVSVLLSARPPKARLLSGSEVPKEIMCGAPIYFIFFNWLRCWPSGCDWCVYL